MATKSAHAASNADQAVTGSTRQHIISRFTKALRHAENLVQLLDEQPSDSLVANSKLESQAYRATLAGALNFEKRHWQACLKSYAAARLVYAALDLTTKSDVFKEVVSNIIDPSIRYAAYKCNLPRTRAVRDVALEALAPIDSVLKEEVLAIDQEAFHTTTELRQKQHTRDTLQQDIPSTITWRSRTLKLEDAAIAQAIATAITRERRLESSFKEAAGEMEAQDVINRFEEVIAARQEAVDVTKTTIEELQASNVEPSDPKMQSLQVTMTALSFSLVEWQIGRNRVLCGPQDGIVSESQAPKVQKKRHQGNTKEILREESANKKIARVRQRILHYDSTLQSLDSVKELKGVAGDAEFLKSIEAAIRYYLSLKYESTACLCIS